MRKILIYQHSGSLNHGCEALLITTIGFINKNILDKEITIETSHKEEDILMGFDKYLLIDRFFLKKYSFKWLVYQFNIRFFHIKKINNYCLFFLKTKRIIKKQNMAIAIGGDNYCYDKGRSLYIADTFIRKNNIPSILLGCSIEPDDINNELLKNLKNFTLITARESITYKSLTDNGFKNLLLIPDGAFTLEKEEICLPVIFNNKVVGLNLNTLSLNYVDNSQEMNKFCEILVEYILNNTDYSIALIPHVRTKSVDDIKCLLPLYEKYCKSNRIFLFNDISLNCKQLKYIISKCEVMIAARTHASIAAYSTCIPTLVLGYSVKAKGIAKDIFGTYENYVLPVQSLKNQDDLINAFKWLEYNKTKIREHLKNIMPEYINRAWQAGEEIKKVIDIEN